MSIKIIKQFSGKKNEAKQNESVVAKLKARRAARKAAEALVAAKKAKKREGEGDGEEVADINLDADTATVMFTDKEANIQVVVGENPKDGRFTVVVATAEKDNLEEEEVLASVTVGEGEEPAAGDPEAEEAKKKEAAVEEARNAIKARLQR